MLGRVLPWLVAGLVPWAGCLEDRAEEPVPSESETAAPPAPSGPFATSSSAFQHQQQIPREHTCDAANTNPPLAFANLPQNGTHIALIMEDPDAPMRTVLHWTFWNLPRNATTLPAKTDPKALGAQIGQPYRGPCPPAGQHRYFFYSFAQTKSLDLADGSDVAALRNALKGNVGATAQFYGTYTRPCVPPVCN